MRHYLYIIVFLLTALTANAQVPEDANRILIHPKSGDVEVYDVDKVSDISFVQIPEANTTLRLILTTDASLGVRVTKSDGCQRYIATCYPASEDIADEDLEAYIIAHKQYDRKVNGAVEFTDLHYNTNYIVATLAFDEYDLPCEITKLSATTADREASAPAKVGDYLYADGTWSTELKTNKTVVGIVFSTNTSATDKTAGYTNGYAMSVKSAGNYTWSTSPSANESGSYISSTDDGDLKDMEGLTHTNALLSNASTHPAAQAAKNFVAAPEGTSGWYLPSIGQLIEICHSLGQLDDTSLERTTSGAINWSKEATVACINNINARLSAVGTGKYDAVGTTNAYYWSSSEHALNSAYYLYINKTYYTSLQAYYKDGKFEVRPVIAF